MSRDPIFAELDALIAQAQAAQESRKFPLGHLLCAECGLSLGPKPKGGWTRKRHPECARIAWRRYKREWQRERRSGERC